MKPPIEIIYVMGSARCGSTLLDLVLDLHPHITGLGELNNLPRMAWKNDELCACGQRGSKCPFWTEVRNRWFATPGIVGVQHYIGLMRRFERYSRIPLLLWLRRRGLPADFDDYALHTRALFESIGAVSGARILVDSSKSPGRALALGMVPGLRLSYVHLVRDVRGVVWSLKKSHEKDRVKGVQTELPGRAAWRAAGLWTVNNATSSGVRRAMNERALLLRYEDFAAAPAESVERIASLTGFDAAPINRLVEGAFHTADRHTVAGNRLRMKSEVSIRPDTSWQKNLTSHDLAAIIPIAGWLMPAYRYRVHL